MVRVSLHKGEITEELVARHNVVLWTHGSRDELLRWNRFCRKHSPAIGFIACDIFGRRWKRKFLFSPYFWGRTDLTELPLYPGAFGYAFTDFGPHFVIKDATGENPITRIVSRITNDEVLCSHPL